MDKIGVYKKLNKARKMLKDRGIKPTGNNKYAGYGYYELQDFMPHILDINEELGLTSACSFGKEEATLTVTDAEDTDKVIVFTSPMSDANLKGCHPVQNLGAVETYIRRYLYQTAYEITESDALNGTQGKDGYVPPKKTQQPRREAPPRQEQPQPGPEDFMDDPIDEGGKIIGIIPQNDFTYSVGFRHLVQLAEGDTEYVKATLKNLGITSSAHITYDIYKKALGYLSMPKMAGVPA